MITTSTPSRPIEPVRIAGKRVQRVGVEHERHAGALEERLDERRGAGDLAQPRADRDDVGFQLEHALDGAEVDGARRVSSSGSVMYSGAIAATIGTHDRGVAIVTSPAPDRSAPIAARCAAPVLPIDPATTSTRPKSPLCESALRGRHDLAHPLARQQLEVRPIELVDERQRNADVGDDEVAAHAFRPAGRPAGSSARPA